MKTRRVFSLCVAWQGVLIMLLSFCWFVLRSVVLSIGLTFGYRVIAKKGKPASVKAGGRPINVTGNADTCGHARTGGSENVRIG